MEAKLCAIDTETSAHYVLTKWESNEITKTSDNAGEYFSQVSSGSFQKQTAASLEPNRLLAPIIEQK